MAEVKNEMNIVVTIKVNCDFSLWQALKLRIAGKNLTPIIESILKEIKEKISG